MLIMLKRLQGCKANVVSEASSTAAERAPLRRAGPLCSSEPLRITAVMRCWPVRPSRFAAVAVRPENAVPRAS